MLHLLEAGLSAVSPETPDHPGDDPAPPAPPRGSGHSPGPEGPGTPPKSKVESLAGRVTCAARRPGPARQSGNQGALHRPELVFRTLKGYG
jgi:hypothetical protein